MTAKTNGFRQLGIRRPAQQVTSCESYSVTVLLPQHESFILFRTSPIFLPVGRRKGGSLPPPLVPASRRSSWGSLEALWDPFGALSVQFSFLFGWPRFGIDFGAQMGAKIMIPVGG